MKSLYADENGYYEWDAHRQLSGKLHEGSIKTFVEGELRNGKRFLLDDYKELFKWAYRHNDGEHLLNDSLYLCKKINEKIRHCSHVKNHESEYNQNRRRLKLINNKALELQEIEPQNRSIRKTLVDSAYLLHDYEQLSETLKEVIENGTFYEIAHIRHNYEDKRLPANVKKLMFLHERRQSYQPKTLEMLVSEPNVMFSSSLPEDAKPAFLEYKHEQEEKPASEVIIEKAISY